MVSTCQHQDAQVVGSLEHHKEDRLLDNADESVTELASLRPATTIIHSGSQPRPPAQICFDRKELMTILNAYGRMVAAGEWRDYSIDTLKDRAIFSIYRRTSEMPIYRIEKNPKLARKQGAYSLIAQQGQILKRGQDLGTIIKLLNQKMLKVVKS
ncbi:DUF2794 domain-containing protein [Cohaesibacter sp. ES.047]|uniref:DUF2794 domain-containing protein n=1 Tax=Cohaesibacter sp. ES.047 TaxID=1798205 RepID=UPI000BB7F552